MEYWRGVALAGLFPMLPSTPDATPVGSAHYRSAPEALMSAAAWVARQAVAERERWNLWCPVLIGVGIGVYFALSEEPPIWTGAIATAAALGTFSVLRRPWPLVAELALVLGLISLGLAAAELRVSLVSSPMLARELRSVTVIGRICGMDLLPSGYRLILDHVTISGVPAAETPVRLRLRASARGLTVQSGDWVQARAQVGPPSLPAAPGSYDFQRDAFFDGIGGVGFAYSGIQAAAPVADAGWVSMLPCRLAALRVDIAERIRAVLPGDTGGMAAALIIGDQGAISKPVMQDMRNSGLAHLLSISGLHINLVAGILFVAVRRLLSLVPRIALYHPIKKWGAIAALLGTLFYVLLAGAPVPAVRAFAMSGMFLLAVILDRTAISMPPVAWAAVIVLLLQPEELIGPSFQMSFAAVVALVAAYEATAVLRLRWRAEGGWRARVGIYLAGFIFTSLVASLATAPYAIYHFNRVSTYGTLANMVAVPLTGFWVMAWAVVTLLLMPFGLERWALVPMGRGIDAIIDIAHAVADWPGAVFLVPVMSAAGLAAATVGGLWLCLWQRSWRLAGIPAMLLGVGTVLFAHAPDVLVADDGRLFAVRDPDGGMLLSSARVDRFEAEIWLRRSAVEAALAWPHDGYGAGGRLACDSLGCLYTASGKVVALVQQPAALPEDCQGADVVISVEPVRISCAHPAVVIDWFDLWRDGAHAIWIGEDGVIDVRSVRQLRGDRPWVVPPPDRPSAD